MDITKMTTEELTKIGYEAFKERERASRRIQQLNVNIMAIEEELEKRARAKEFLEENAKEENAKEREIPVV